MKMATVERWARTMDITPEDFNEYLEKLNYQVEVKNGTDGTHRIWHITEKGKQYGRVSRNPLKRALVWNFDAAFAVKKVNGKHLFKSMIQIYY